LKPPIHEFGHDLVCGLAIIFDQEHSRHDEFPGGADGRIFVLAKIVFKLAKRYRRTRQPSCFIEHHSTSNLVRAPLP
jgi:hypothetical protein